REIKHGGHAGSDAPVRRQSPQLTEFIQHQFLKAWWILRRKPEINRCSPSARERRADLISLTGRSAFLQPGGKMDLEDRRPVDWVCSSRVRIRHADRCIPPDGRETELRTEKNVTGLTLRHQPSK